MSHLTPTYQLVRCENRTLALRRRTIGVLDQSAAMHALTKVATGANRRLTPALFTGTFESRHVDRGVRLRQEHSVFSAPPSTVSALKNLLSLLYIVPSFLIARDLLSYPLSHSSFPVLNHSNCPKFAAMFPTLKSV
jgi:hypothetical protein